MNEFDNSLLKDGRKIFDAPFSLIFRVKSMNFYSQVMCEGRGTSYNWGREFIIKFLNTM